MAISIPERIMAARAGTNMSVICRVPSGWALMCDMQFLRGYSILLADPPVPSLNDLSLPQRLEYLGDMAMVGDALLEVTGAFRINYAIMGNSDPYLHAHIIPRYMNEPDQFRQGLPWSYPKKLISSTLFDGERDRELMDRNR